MFAINSHVAGAVVGARAGKSAGQFIDSARPLDGEITVFAKRRHAVSLKLIDQRRNGLLADVVSGEVCGDLQRFEELPCTLYRLIIAGLIVSFAQLPNAGGVL